VGLPQAGNGSLGASQNPRAGTTLSATVTSSTPAVGTLVTTAGAAGSRTVVIPQTTSSSPSTVAAGGVAFRALATGQTTVSATIPGFIVTTAGTSIVTVSTPGITFSTFPAAVGVGLQATATAHLGASQHGGVTVRIQSSDPNVVRVSATGSTLGSEFIDVPLANGLSDASYFVQVVDGAPVSSSVTITATAPGFNQVSNSTTVVQAALKIDQLATSIAATAANDNFIVRVGTRSTTTGDFGVEQPIRGGSSLTVTLTNSNATVAQLVTQAGGAQSRNVTINGATSFSPLTVNTGGIAFDPLQAGPTTVTAAGGNITPTSSAVVSVTVTP
jgi:hypothetical protein